MTHSYPDRENTLALLTDWQKHHAAVQKMMDGIKTSIGLDSDGPMFDTVWKLFDAYTGALAVEVGDFDGWLEWYQAENDMGARCYAAGYDGKLRKVKTLAHLYGLIAESRKRVKS
jgi:hypothetical protein